jgi:hypothetical protein
MSYRPVQPPAHLPESLTITALGLLLVCPHRAR